MALWLAARLPLRSGHSLYLTNGSLVSSTTAPSLDNTTRAIADTRNKEQGTRDTGQRSSSQQSKKLKGTRRDIKRNVGLDRPNTLKAYIQHNKAGPGMESPRKKEGRPFKADLAEKHQRRAEEDQPKPSQVEGSCCGRIQGIKRLKCLCDSVSACLQFDRRNVDPSPARPATVYRSTTPPATSTGQSTAQNKRFCEATTR
ncbi:hypothetical protein EGW08_001938 [Elysia chlorotica]|uniref:Uncharacterized protein n=1 Tax=Elysia chlorotica TaxID=188477 RepID=A0A433U972_ELYCH|nr:hypothetical protein EGW08_001938 [Elysia chlorotica]